MERGDSAGGSGSLAELIDDYGAALFSDFLYHYRIDLSKAMFGKREERMAPRLLLSLIERLPEGSEFRAEVSGDRDNRAWTTEVQLLAALVNSTNSQTLVLANAPKSVRDKFEYIVSPSEEKQRQKNKPKGLSKIAAMFGPAKSF